MIICEQMLVNYISVFKDAYWPGGRLAPHVKVRTDSERCETKEQAQQKLLDNIPGRAAGGACRCRHTRWASLSNLAGSMVRIPNMAGQPVLNDGQYMSQPSIFMVEGRRPRKSNVSGEN